MPLAKDVASELRKLADSLDASPEAVVVYPWIFFSARTKNEFLSTVRLLPRPLKKHISDPGSDYSKLRIEYTAKDIVEISCSVPQSLTCELVEPAKPAVYRCDPILSAEEDAQLEAI